ncbi:hypothetical protein [Amycolatopsis sp. FDAARGOS 1241]|uniref:hypothetical protein n=1 Tax=Amycolatopsis sp. FDAARGOS 1241 TaxID=2778070 RepID=UPI001951B4A6|nr:hypothetical protein [Amycolatopsis sp. FDAARGOS 1241]QRP46405.1 hypothetical protein I6J71_46635 [Amycolatopsis sp. FDAARGOS 1241]
MPAPNPKATSTPATNVDTKVTPQPARNTDASSDPKTGTNVDPKLTIDPATASKADPKTSSESDPVPAPPRTVKTGIPTEVASDTRTGTNPDTNATTNPGPNPSPKTSTKTGPAPAFSRTVKTGRGQPAEFPGRKLKTTTNLDPETSINTEPTPAPKPPVDTRRGRPTEHLDKHTTGTDPIPTGPPPGRFSASHAPPKPDGWRDARANPGRSPKRLPGPQEWGNRRETAPSARLVLERFDPKKTIARQFDGDGLKGGRLEGAATHIRYDVRRFEVAPGVWVREFTVLLELTSSTRSVSVSARNKLAQDLQNHLDNTVNQHYTLPGGDQLHVRIDANATNDPADDSWTSDPSRGVPVNIHDSTKDKGTPRTDQTNWDVNDNATGLTHEIMHFIGLGEGYRNTTLLFNRTDQIGVMGRDAWTDSSLTDDNLANIEDLSRQAVIHDHHLGDPDAKPNRPYRPPPSTQDPSPRTNLHTPEEAPNQSVVINGKDVPAEPGSTVARDVFGPAQHELLGTHGLEGVYVGSHGPGNFHLAVRASISEDAPREHARITADLDKARTQTDPDALAAAGGVRVHVLNPDGSWTSHGPETGRPVHVVKTTVDGHDTYLGTKENVHIGRAKVSYPGPTALLDKKDVKRGQQFDKEKRKVLHRGEFEVETIRGEHYVRMYTAVLNPAQSDSEHKDVHQDPDGKVTPFSGSKGGIFWVGGGRPMRAVQWTSKYETDPNLKPGMQPVLRSFLVPIDTFTKVSKEATVEALSQDNTLAMNVDQTGDVNQFGLRGRHFEEMQKNALKGSLVTYSANQNYELPHLAGRREDIADLHTRLGLPPNFRSDELGKDNDPWFEWTKDKGEDRKYFRNDPENLRALAKKLSELYHTHLELKGGPKQDAYSAPAAYSIPADKGGKSKHAEPSTREQREQDLNVFLNTRGPSGSVIKQLTDGIADTLGADLDRGPDTVALDGNTVRTAVVTAAKNIGGTLKDVVNKEFRALHTHPVTKYVSPEAKIESLEKMRQVMADRKLVDAIAKNTAEQVTKSTLDSIGANRGVEGPGGFRERLTTAVEKAVKDQFTITDAKFSPAIEDGFKNNAGARKNYFAGNRADAVAAEVASALKNADLEKHAQESGLGFDRETVKRRLSEGVLPEAVCDVTTKNLVGLHRDQLQHEFENGLANAAAKVRASLDTDPVLKFTTEAQRRHLADQAGQVLNPDTVKGITFTPVSQHEVDEFMAKVPHHATQAEIGAAIATDEKRVKADFNTRENTYDPTTKAVGSKTFDNEYSEFTEKGHLQLHPRGEFERHQRIGAGLDTVIGDELGKPDDHRGAERILDHLVRELDGPNPDYHESLRRKFDEVVAVAGKHNRYRIDDKATKPNTFGEHAQMVLNQYLRLTRGEQDAGRFVSRDALAKAILFHDMEKQNSKNQFGDGQQQHHNEPEHRGAVEQLNRHEGLWKSERDFRIARAMVDADPFGFYFRGMGGIDAKAAYDFVTKLAHDVGGPGGKPVRAEDVRNLFTEFHQYYQADFSSYYADSHFVRDGNVVKFGDKSGLSGLKESHQHGPLVTTDNGHRFEYGTEYEAKYQELKKLFDDAVDEEAEQDRTVLTEDTDGDPKDGGSKDDEEKGSGDKDSGNKDSGEKDPDKKAEPDTRPLTQRLPEYARDGQALGALVVTGHQGVQDVGTTITRLVHGMDRRANPPAIAGLDAITGTLEGPGFESFLGPGRRSMVRVGEKWYEVHVKANLDLGAVTADGITTQPHPTIGDVNDQNQATHAQASNDTVAKTIGTSYFALIPPGAYVSVAPTVQLATAAQVHTSTVTGTEQRVIRSAGDVDEADVKVTYSITVTNQDGSLAGSTVDGQMSLLLSQDLGNLEPHEVKTPANPKAEWAENIELLTPEAVLLDEQGLFDKVSKLLHPSVTKFGAPGRTALREFVSGGGIRGVLGTALQGGPVVSNDLLSPHGSHRDAVQLRARPKDVELVGVVPGDSELRFNDSAVNGGSTAASSKSGVDLAVTVGGGAYLPRKVGGLVGVTGSVSSKVTETATAGTSVTTKNTVEAKGDIGLYKVKVDVDVVTSSGEKETVAATAYVRLGLPEAKAQGLPVPDGTRPKLSDAGSTRHEPPYLAAAAAAGHVRAGSFSPAAKVQAQIETALRDRPGMARFLPAWASGRDARTDSSRDVGERLANLRKLTAALSPAALKSKMDSLLGPGVSVQLKRRGLFTDEYLSVTVKAKLSPGRHLGQATGRSVKGSVATSPSMSSATAVDRSWSLGLEGRMVIPTASPLTQVSVSPAVVPVQYSNATTWKNSGGPTVTTTFGTSGSPDAQVFEHDVEFEVEITSYTRNRPWVKRLTPGSPFRVTPKVSTVAKTGDPALPKISGKVDLWVNDGSALKKDPKDFLPGNPEVKNLTGTVPAIDDLLTTKPAAPPNFLHVEAFTGTESLRDAALRQLERAAGGDGVLGLPGGEARKRVDSMFSPETFRGGLPKFLRQGARSGGFRYERRVADRVGGLGMDVSLSNPKVVAATDAGGSETTFAGGAKAGFEQSNKKSLEGNVQLGVTIRPDGSNAHGQGQLFTTAKWSPWTRTSGGSKELGASVDHVSRANAKGRTVLVQYDADVRLVAESRQESVVNGSTSRAGADVKLPGAVYVRMTEDQAREQGLLPKVDARTDPPATIAPPALVDGRSSALGAAVVEDAPDLSQLIRDARANLGRTGGKLLPKSVLDDSMTNLQRTLDLAAPDSVTSLVDSALDGGAPLLLHDAGVLSTDTYQVLLKATITKTGFAGLVNDGGEVDHVVNATTTDKQNSGRGSSYGGQFRGAGRGLFRDNDPDVSGYEGLRLGLSGSKAKTDQTVSSVATTTAIKSSQSGPAVRFRHEVKFALVVQRGGKSYPVTEQIANVTVRAAADDHKLETEGRTAPQEFRAETRELTAADRTPEKLAEWQARGAGALPPSSLTEGLRGSSAVRDGAVRALRLAGAGTGLTDPGTGAGNTLGTALTNEVLQAHLPRMLDGPLTVPDLHEGSLVKNGHGSVKVYARLTGPDLTGLSDSVKLERSDQNTATFTGEAKETLSGENQYQPGVGGVTDPKDFSHSWTGADVRNPAPLSDPAASVAGGQRSTVAKPKGRSGLVGFDVEYRVVADVGGGRTAAVEVKVPVSAVVRLSAADLEKLLGEALPDAITQAQDAVKEAAAKWREAEEAVEQAQRDADDRWLDERDSVKTLTSSAARLRVPTSADPVGELRQALADVENEAKNAGRELREGNAEITRLQDVAEQSLILATVTEAGSPERQHLLDQAARARQSAQAIRDNQPALAQRRQRAQDRAARIANVLDEHRRDHADFASLRDDSLRQVREAREKADEARQKWWRAKEEIDWRLATHRWPTPKIESRFDPRFDRGQATSTLESTVDPASKAGTSTRRDVVEAPDTETPTISGWDTTADRPYDFDVAEIELRQVTDASGKVVAVSFLPAAENTSAVEHDWLARNSGEVTSLDEGVTTKTLDPAVAEAREQGIRPDLGRRRFGEWAGKSPAPWDGDSFFVFAHGKPQSVKLTLLGGRTVRVDGDTFARIVARSAPFAQAGPKSSVTLIACSTGQVDGSGGVAQDFQRALAGLGGPVRVHAPTKPTLFGRGTATLGQGLGSTGAFTAITDGGHFRTFGGRPEDNALVGLVRALADTHVSESPAGPIPLTDPEATRALASTVERQLADIAASTGELRLIDVQDLVARHERPDVIYSAVLTRLAERGVAVHTVVDTRRDPGTGVWTRVPVARGVITVTGKGTWHDGELSRPARLNPARSAGPAREPLRPRADAAHYAETVAEHHLDGEPAPRVTVPGDHVDRFTADVTRHLAHLGFGDLPFDVHADHTRLTGELVGEPGVTVDFATSAVTTTVLTDHTGAARGLTFLAPAEAAKVRTWLRQTAGENLLVEADPDELRAFATGHSADLRGRGPGEGGIRVLTPWANELAQGRTFLVTGHGGDGRAQVLVPGPDGTPRAVHVDGETLAKIVTASPEFADADADSVTLFQCGAARRLAAGGLAHDFHAALEANGGPAIVHAATDSVLANHRGNNPGDPADEPSAPLFGATDDAFTAVVRGGHWETLGRPLDAHAVVAELTDALLKGWRYAPAVPGPGPIPLSDRAATLALAAEVVNAAIDGRPQEELAALAGGHQEPDLVTAVVNAYFVATALPELVMPEQGPPYESAGRLVQDLHTAAADRTPPSHAAPLLGPDLFGLLRAPQPPDFLRGHDYRNLTVAQGVLLLNTLDLTADERPTAETTAPANLPHEAGYALEQERPDHQLTTWAPGEVDPLPKVTETPLLMHAIWLGGPLRDAGTMHTFRANFGSAAQRFSGNVLSVLWTDVPRRQTELARTTAPPAEGPDPLADVRDFVAWAQEHNVHLVNVDEVFTSEHPMLLQGFYNSEAARRAGPGYAAASDILRMELMHRFGGLYTDGDNVVQGLDDLVTAARSPEGYVTHRQGPRITNSAFAMPKGHPFARAYLDQQRENYGKTQRNLLPEGTRLLPQAFFATPHGRVHRNSIMYRTGPEALSQTARRIGLANAHQLPGMAAVLMNSDASWFEPPPTGEATQPQLGRDDTLALTQRVVQTLVRGLYSRNGDLHLTAVEPAVRRHPDPDLVWHAALSFLAADADLAPLVRTVTDRHTYTGDPHDVQLPPAARALLHVDADRVHHTLGEVHHAATLRSPDSVLVSDVDTPVEYGARDLARSLAAQNGSPLPPIHVTGRGPDGRAHAREAARKLAAHLRRMLGDRDLLARVPVKIRAAGGPAVGVTVSFRPEHGDAVEFRVAPRSEPPRPVVFPGLDGKPYTDSLPPFDGYRGGESTVVVTAAVDGSGEPTKAAERPPTLVFARGALAGDFTRQLRSRGADLPVSAEPVDLPDAVADTHPAVSYLVAGDLAVTADDRRTIEELVRTAELDWWYRPDPPAGPVRLDDRAGTLALLGNAVSALRRPFRSGTPALDLTAAARSVHRHERPDLLWTAVLELAPRDARFVLDRRLVAGRWQHVELPESARERFTVTGKGVWRDGVVRRPVRFNAQPGPAADYTVEPATLPLDDTVARWVAESTVERMADGLPAPRVEVSGPDEGRARFVARIQAALTELTPVGVTPHAAADLVAAGPGETAGVTISLPATPAPPTLSPAGKAVAVGLEEEFTLLQLHGVSDTLLAKPGPAADVLLDLAREVAHGTGAGKAADAVEVLDRHGALDAALSAKGGRALLREQFRRLFGTADLETYARDLATALRAFAEEQLPLDVLREAVRGALEGWCGAPGTFEGRVARTRETLWVLRRFGVVNLAWLQRWRTAEHIRQYAEHMKEQAERQDELRTEVTEAEDAFLASVAEAGAGPRSRGDHGDGG